MGTIANRVVVPFSDPARPERSGALVLDDGGVVHLRAGPALARSLERAVSDPSVDLSPLQINDRQRGLALAASLAKGLAARLLTGEFMAGAFELRSFVNGGWARVILNPGNIDPDAAWGFLLALEEARLEAATA